MLRKIFYITGLLISISCLIMANEGSFLSERKLLVEKYQELKFSGAGSEEIAGIVEKIINLDEQLIWRYQDSLEMFSPVRQRIQGLQQEKQIYLAQNIQLASDVEELRNQQNSLYIVAAFLGLLFIALFILFLMQLNKIKELATEAHELYQLGEHTRSELAKYEKRYFVMKEANKDIRLELSKSKEHMNSREKELADLKKQLAQEISKTQSLSDALKRNQTD